MNNGIPHLGIVWWIWLIVLMLFNVPILMVRHKMSQEVNIYTAGGGEQFHSREWWKWSFAKQRRLWKLHRRYYPDSRLRAYFLACYILALLWMFGVGALL